MSIRVKMPTTTSIEFEITAPSSGWVGFGFGTSMTNCDMFTIEASGGPGTITDTYSSGHAPPSTDSTNNIALSTSTSGATNVYSVTRDLDTTDALEDYIIVDGSNNIIYAWSSSTTVAYHGAGSKGALTLTIDSVTQTAALSSGSIKYDTKNATAHALLLYFGWGVLSFILVVSGRYSKYFYSFRIYIHTAAGLTVLLFTIIAVAKFGSSDLPRASANSLGDKHTSLGSAVIILTIITIALGSTAKMAQKFLQKWSVVVKFLRVIHLLVGYGVIVYCHIVFLSGLYLFDSTVTFLFYIHIGILIFTYI